MGLLQFSIQGLWDTLLSQWVSSNRFSRAASKAFEIQEADPSLIRLRKLLLDSGSIEAPRLVELSSDHMQNHLGAYSWETNKIYIDPGVSSSQSLASLVLAHELGHWIDRQVNGNNTSHKAVETFASEILELPYGNDIVTEKTGPANGKGAGEITLANGERVAAEFFDTKIHTNWIKDTLPFLNFPGSSLTPDMTYAPTGLLREAQEDTDKFNRGTQGLQTNSASHFDKNHLVGGQKTLRLRYEDALKQFNTNTTIPLVTADPFTGGNNRDDAIPNPRLEQGLNLNSSMPTGVALLLYRFGQICHTIEDFYSHSNWVELSNKDIITKNSLFLTGLDLPNVLKEGEFVPGTSVLITGRGDWSNKLKVAGRDDFEISQNQFAARDVYFTVDSDIDPEDGGGVISATTLDGKIVYGLVSGGVAESIWKDDDYNPFLRDPQKTSWFQKKYFEGFGHGGWGVGNGAGQRLGPLNKDSTSNKNFPTSQRLANLQVRHEWDRLGNLIYKSYGRNGLERFANAAVASEYREQYINTYSTPGGKWIYPGSSSNKLSSFSSELISGSAGDMPELASAMQVSNQESRLPGNEGVVSGMNDWLASVDSNRYMFDIGIVQTHNSMAYKPGLSFQRTKPGAYQAWLNGEPGWEYTAYGFVGLLNQKGYNLEEQFKGGVRSFSLLTSSDSVVNDTQFTFTHNGFDIGDRSDEAFRQLFTSLANNPSEFVSFSIKPYGGGDGAVEFNKNNEKIATDSTHSSKFWNSTPGKRIHSFFFMDGYALQGNPRVWDDDIFAQWGIEIPEEKKALLRGREIFYRPSMDIKIPVIPKLKDLRGKFAIQDESWIGVPYLDDKNGMLEMNSDWIGVPDLDDKNGMLEMNTDSRFKVDLKNYPQYAADFPMGIEFNRGKYRRDEGQDDKHKHYLYRDSRLDVAKFIDNFANKPKVMASAAWLGAAEGSGRNLVEAPSSGLLRSHDNWWNVGGYFGDDGSPSIADAVLTGNAQGIPIDGGRIKKPVVGTVNATFFTDFGAKPYYGAKNTTAYGKSPASIIAEAQPRVEILISPTSYKYPNSNVFTIEIKSNIPGIDLANYGILITNLSASKKQPVILNSGKTLEFTDSSILAYADGLRNYLVAVPKDNPEKSTYFTVQAKNLQTGQLFGAPEIVSSPPVLNPLIPPIRGVKLFQPVQPLAGNELVSTQGSIASLAKSPLNFSFRDALQFMDDTGKWIDTEFTNISYHHELLSAEIAELKTPSLKQRLERGERALWVEDLNAFDDHRTQIFKVDSFNQNVPVYINNYDLAHDRIILVNSNGQEYPFPEELYNPSSIETFAKKLSEYNIVLNYKPLPEYAPTTLILNTKQLGSPLTIDASSFANDVQGLSLSFSSFDGAIPFLTLDNGLLVAKDIDPTFFGRTYTGHVSITNGLSVSPNIEITIALDPKLIINGDTYSAQTAFSIDLDASDYSYTIYALHGRSEGKDGFMPIASSIGMASGSPEQFDSSNYEYYLADINDYGDVSFWLNASSGNLEQLDLKTVSKGVYHLSLGEKSVAELRDLGYIGTAPAVKAVSCNDSFFDGLGFDLSPPDKNLKAKGNNLFWDISLSIDLCREAAYSSTVGLYLFDKQCGSIIDPLTGQRFKNNDSEWFRDAERLAVWTGSVDNLTNFSVDTKFKMNGFIDPDLVALLPYMKVEEQSSTVYVSSFDSLNPNSSAHIKALSSNTLGFDDTWDRPNWGDFDDMVMTVRNLILI